MHRIATFTAAGLLGSVAASWTAWCNLQRQTSTHCSGLTTSKAELRYISPETLVAWARDNNRRFQVVDVRTTDFTQKGSKIRGALNFPVTQIRADRGSSLVELLWDEPTVIFHCMYSEHRGPESTLIYLQRRAMVEEAEVLATVPYQARRQEVYVLQGGFSRFHKQYSGDYPELFEPARRNEHLARRT